jgi:hypothetical protein
MLNALKKTRNFTANSTYALDVCTKYKFNLLGINQKIKIRGYLFLTNRWSDNGRGNVICYLCYGDVLRHGLSERICVGVTSNEPKRGS